MNNWLCIKNNVVQNVIVAEKSFTEKNQDVLAAYDRFENQDDLPEPKPQLGSVWDGQKWIIKAQTVIPGTDFSGQNLTGRDFKHQDLTGCKFVGATIDKCRFEWVKPTFSLIGAIWQGKTIKHGPVLIPSQYYWTLLTDVVVFVSCSEASAGLPLVSTDAEKNAYESGDKAGVPALWWAEVRAAYTAQVNAWAAP